MLARHCSRCGTATERVTLEERTRARCPSCGWIDYENPKPAAGAILVRGGRVLLSRRARPPCKDLWDLPGGFLEAGEDPHEAIVRELHEEASLSARVVRLLHVAAGLYDDQPTLNLVYLVEAEGEPRPADDSAEMKWFDPDQLPEMAWPHEVDAIRRWQQEHAASKRPADRKTK